MKKIWKLKENISSDPIIQILYNRGIIKSDDDPAPEKFLKPNFETDFYPPDKLPDFDLAIKRLTSAIDSKEKIGIFADYDADGIPGAALLFRALKKLGVNLSVFIPSRQDGYGFNKSGIDFLISEGCSLIISVDLGIREFEFSEYIKDKGSDLIITDHHEPGEMLPVALAIVNPKIKTSNYQFKELSGAGVVFKLLQGLAKVYPGVINEKFLKWNLDLVAISTISDVVPLTSENRIIAKYGLLVLQKTKNVGLQELYKISGIDQTKIDSYIVGFQIGPRINAPGRLDHATASFNLLTTDDKQEAYENAKQLQEKNEQRQFQMDKIFQQAVAQISKKKLDENKLIMIKSQDWAKGVIGPVASQLLEKYNRPIIIFSENGQLLDGSCRSISCFNIVEALEKFKDILIGFGGHKAAAGVHLYKKEFAELEEKLVAFANKNISDEDILPKINIDFELEPKQISISLVKKIEELEPFGMGNPKPIFLTRSLRLQSHRLVGREDKHLQLRFESGLQQLKGVIFNHDLNIDDLKSGEFYDIVFQPQVNFWNGKNWLDLKLIDLKVTKKDETI